MKAFLVAIIGAAIFWTLSTLPFVDTLNHISLIEQLGINFRTVLVTMGGLMLMFPLLNSFFLQPLREAIEARTRRIEETFTEAENLRARMEQMRTEYEQRLVAAEASAREQIQAQVREAQQLRDHLRQEAVQQAEELKKRAIQDIERERERTLSDLRVHVVNLTLQATEKLVGETVDDAKSRKLVEEFIEKVEVPR
jgi:F-type H+-transporting ATPase subunit b